jgi:hypothetical protein
MSSEGAVVVPETASAAVVAAALRRGSSPRAASPAAVPGAALPFAVATASRATSLVSRIQIPRVTRPPSAARAARAGHPAGGTVARSTRGCAARRERPPTRGWTAGRRGTRSPIQRSASRWRRTARRRFVDADRSPVETRSVQRADGLLGLFGRRHLDESESARPSGFAIGHHRRRIHAAKPGERLAQAIRGGRKRQASHKQPHRHLSGSFRALPGTLNDQACGVVRVARAYHRPTSAGTARSSSDQLHGRHLFREELPILCRETFPA